jgi:putative membrane protein
MTHASTSTRTEQAEYRGEALAVRGTIGGLFMGLANLVPGISGGTMLLAVGIYPQFINGIAEVSTFTFRPKTLLTLGCIVGAALIAVLGFAGMMSSLVVHQRWIMYSLFIGLTLGGVPLLWSMLRPADATVVVSSIAGIALMAAIALVSPAGGAAPGGEGSHAYVMYFLGGLAGASAMVLPGLSGGYLLLVLGQYVAILTGLATFKDGLSAGDVPMVLQSMHVLLPVGIGVAVGVVGVSNLVKILLQRCERPTLGLLLGLLLGAVIGLWPFQHGVQPGEGSLFRGDRVVIIDGQATMQTTGRVIGTKDFDTAFFTPTPLQVAGAVAFILIGFGVSTGVAHLGSNMKRPAHARERP